MDNIDNAILKCFSRNARMNASEIAENVGLSVSAVIERIKKLENNGTIEGYSVVLASSMLNKDVIAMMSVNIDHPKYNQAFVDTVKKNDNVVECMYIAGDIDYLLKIVTDNTKTLEKTLNAVKSIEGVSKTKTNLVLSVVKDDHSVVLNNLK